MVHYYTISVVRPDTEYVYVHGVFYKHCSDRESTISPSAPSLQETSAQAERYSWVMM